MSPDGSMAPGWGFCLGFSAAGLFVVWGHALRPNRAAAEAPLASAQGSSAAASPVETGPERLKQQVRVTVETNAPPAASVTTNAPARSLKWDIAWKDWDERFMLCFPREYSHQTPDSQGCSAITRLNPVLLVHYSATEELTEELHSQDRPDMFTRFRK